MQPLSTTLDLTLITPAGAASGIYPPASLLLSSQTSEDREQAGRDLTIAPLSICINIPTLPPHATREVRHHDLLGALRQEISLYSGNYSNRPVTQVMWRNPYALMEPAEVTHVMHHLSSHFHLNPGTCREYCAEIDLLAATEEQIALLRGLGFNQVLVRLAPKEDGSSVEETAATLQRRMERVRDYGFQSLGIKLVYRLDGRASRTLPQVIDLIVRLQPDRVVLCDPFEGYQWDRSEQRPMVSGQQTAAFPSWEADPQNPFTLLYRALRNAGFRVVGNDCFVTASDTLAEAQNSRRLRRTVLNYNAGNAADLLGLGPGAYSQLGRHYRCNTPEIAAYVELLARRRPPVKGRFTLDEQGRLLLLLINQLLCYHHLKVAYLETRYNVELTSVLTTAFERLRGVQARDPSLLHFSSDGCINLTPEGIFHLRQLCETLISLGTAGKFIIHKTD